MNTTQKLLCTGAVLLAGCALFSNAAGPLTPPGVPGSPAADMPSLAEVREAALLGRTAIPGGTATVTISLPGSYVLTGNLTVGAVNGIVISANDVTLDLGGHTIATTSGSTGAYRGIFVSGQNIVIRNGRIRGNYVNVAGVLTGGGFSGGVEGDFSVSGAGSNVVCEDLQVTGCQNGIDFYWQEGNYSVRRCTVHHGQSGITLAGVPAGIQNTVSECQVTRCTLSGITAGLVMHSAVVMVGAPPLTPTAIYASQAIGCRGDGGALSIGHRSDMP